MAEQQVHIIRPSHSHIACSIFPSFTAYMGLYCGIKYTAPIWFVLPIPKMYNENTGWQNMHEEHAQCDMREDKNVKDSDLSFPFIYFLFYRFVNVHDLKIKEPITY